MINRTVFDKPQRATVTARNLAINRLARLMVEAHPTGKRSPVRWSHLKAAEDQIAGAFSFLSYSAFCNWHDNKCPDLNLSIVQGPHALTLLKMLAIKHGVTADE